MHYLNLGCGTRFQPSWTNINFTSTGEGVLSHDLTQGIPFSDNSFDAIYHSHVLEHFPTSQAESFIKECYRVLRPKGVLRVVVPDLEGIARMYLHSLERAIDGDKEWEQNYQWILLELYDQTVRNQPGGEMINFLRSEKLANREFIVNRCGTEIENIITIQSQVNGSISTSENNFQKLLKHIYRLFRYADYRHQAILRIILNSTELKTLQLGEFRQSGEVHQWMYDRYSLSVLLKNCGLEEITDRTADQSYIPNWSSFNLDTEPNGCVYKPDSLYMEAIKPI